MSHFPSGDHAGDERYFGLKTNSSAMPVSGSMFQIDPAIETVIRFPSGDQAGYQGVELGAIGK
jgi:hypothetical protein